MTESILRPVWLRFIPTQVEICLEGLRVPGKS